MVVQLDSKMLARMGDFIEGWMVLSRHERKTFSHSGALLTRGLQPVHYICPVTGDRYFDPGNYIYSMSFNMFFPALTDRYNWNQETKGDIIEALMGLAYLKKHSQYQQDKLWIIESMNIAAFLDTVVFLGWAQAALKVYLRIIE